MRRCRVGVWIEQVDERSEGQEDVPLFSIRIYIPIRTRWDLPALSGRTWNHRRDPGRERTAAATAGGATDWAWRWTLHG